MHVLQVSLLASLISLTIAMQKSITPHEQFSSSIGVLGCYMNSDRAAYLPWWPTCDDFCKKISYQGREVIVAHVDTSGGNHDISYDAYNMLVTGFSAADHPIVGGGVLMNMETIDPSNCASLFTGGKMTFSAPTGSAFPLSCPADSWVGQHHELVNIVTSTCTYGIDEICSVNLYNQMICPSGSLAGANIPLKNKPVYNRKYGTGVQYVAP